MGIPVTCPNGHQFSVKDKYAGKKGMCPYCEGQVVVRVPDALSSKELKNAYTEAVASEQRKGQAAQRKGQPSVTDSSIFENAPDEQTEAASGSFLGSSVVRHNFRCKCGQSVPMWFARCPKCGSFLEQF
ncbi:MAG: hypothetical protein AAF961_09180 [Planctomycetota bacterium]